MRRFTPTQFGVGRKRFWYSPQLWRGQIKIIHRRTIAIMQHKRQMRMLCTCR